MPADQRSDRAFNPITTLRGLLRELGLAIPVTADYRSRLRLCLDLVLFRVLRLWSLPGKDRERTIRLRGGARITYRLNRGDIQSIREVWMDEGYRLPFDLRPTVVVDLGANIGLTSLWLHRRYGCRTIVAVEPSPASARLARMNLATNHVDAVVMEAAIGSRDGEAFLAERPESNLTHLASEGRPVRLMSMPRLLDALPSGATVDLLKLDIEGSEAELFDGDLGWLDRVTAIIIELHLDDAGNEQIVQRLEGRGFRFLPSGAAFPDSMTAFIRRQAHAPVARGASARVVT